MAPGFQRRPTARAAAVDRAADEQGGRGAAVPEAYWQRYLGRAGGGAPVDGRVRGQVERATGSDLQGARVHTGPEAAEAARSMGARAFTVGQDVHFGAGQYQPGTREGDRLIAHELAHAAQQGPQAGPPQAKLAVSSPGDAHEQEADAIAERALDGGTHAATVAPTRAARQVMRQSHPAQAGPDEALDLMREIATFHHRMQRQADTAQDEAQRRQAYDSMRSHEAPLLARLRQLIGTPPRFPTAPEPVMDGVLAALQLETVGSALNEWAQTGQGAAADEAQRRRMQREGGGGAGDEWCGMFCVAQFTHSGIDPALRSQFHNTEHMVGFFNYNVGSWERSFQWIYADSRWQDLAAYHTTRNARRRWWDARAIHDTANLPPIRPGDIVLVDNVGGERPDHIAMVLSYNPTTHELFTIEGNAGGFVVDQHPRGDAAVQSLTGRGVRHQGSLPGADGGHVAVNHRPDITQEEDSDEAERRYIPHRHTRYQHAHSRIFGIGRPSLVDFERHDYSTSRAMPTRPPRGR